MTFDSRSSTLFAAVASDFWGPSLERSSDFGQTWERSMEGLQFEAGGDLSVQRVWHIEAAPENQPGVAYAGVEPAGLFRSNDDGRSWQEVPGLNRHPSRERWMPGAGGQCLYSIALDPADPLRLYAGISTGGAFRSQDGGESWQPINQGVRADFLPDPYPDLGQCTHKLLLHPDKPDTLFQQNHCGVYRSSTAGACWEDIGDGRLPSRFGFSLAVHPHNASTIYTIPLQSDEVRLTPAGRMAVWRSRDAGESWQPLTCGLPAEDAFLVTLREGMATDTCDEAGIYAGTTAGQIFSSRDEGNHWQTLAGYLPPVLSVEAAYVSRA
ncbi:MAG: WD40/YVTN/BNR-like repeat-containing protein [Dehalococcoidia bacterium]